MRSFVGRLAERRSLGGLQCRLDDPGDADGHLVLKLEDVFQRAVETVGPEMRAGLRVDQLRGDAHLRSPALRTEPSRT